ncbi:type II secretion system protein E [Methanobacterium lacus]|uniref:Type II secretion system protein E n=1 Tax=Methanobacterium lacus (strain AL-21) TaxID=877455 RepID=F0T9G4_METLA|nr:CpaF family protein [Methanobacterium lacus]ADZ08712.1 type II secretion system protein E [Methanobacterium lacus]
MKDKRKEILRDLLGEFASDDDVAEESNDIFRSKSEDKEEVIEESSEDSEEPEFNLDKVMKRPTRRPKTVKKVSNVLKAEIVEDGLIPNYNVNLPKFSDNERQIFNEVREKLVEVAVAQGEDFRIDEGSFIGEVKEFLRSKGVRDVDRLATQISQEMLGYGQLDPMIKDDDLEEIMVIGINKNVFVYHRKIGMMITNVIFDDDAEIKAIIDVIARQVNRRIDQQTPILDARLPDGSRVNATIPPVSADGATLTIRKFRKDPLTIVDLINFKTLSSHLAGFLWVCTDGLGVKPCNAIIAGGTGSGKTTTLNAITAFTPPRERIITIEDTLELQLPHTHVLRMETRPPNIEGKGELTMDILVKNSLRQRPDRVIVGEVRGGEAVTLFTALNTGHSGMGTVHSNTARETVTRLVNPPMQVPTIMIPALDFIIMQNRMYRPEGGSIRRVTEVAEVVGMEEGNVQLNRVFEWNNVTDKVEYVGIASQTLREIADLRGIGITEIEEEIEKRRLLLEYLADNNIRSISEVGTFIHNYYKDPDEILEQIL